MNEFDQRQYRLMKEYLEGFEAGSLNLRIVIDSLQGLMNVLQESQDEWRASFNREWWTLEEIYAIASDRGQAYFHEADQDTIYRSISNMKNLLNNVICDCSE